MSPHRASKFKGTLIKSGGDSGDKIKIYEGRKYIRKIREKLMEERWEEIRIYQELKDNNLSLQEAISIGKGNITSSVSAFTAFK